MSKFEKVVRDYWSEQSNFFTLDPEVLNVCIDSLSDEERNLLVKDNRNQSEEELFEFLQKKIFNRHNDICDGSTTVNDDGTIVVSSRSSITELDITLSTLNACNKGCIYHICDIEKSILPSMSFETIADLSSAIIIFNTVNDMEK